MEPENSKEPKSSMSPIRPGKRTHQAKKSRRHNLRFGAAVINAAATIAKKQAVEDEVVAKQGDAQVSLGDPYNHGGADGGLAQMRYDSDHDSDGEVQTPLHGACGQTPNNSALSSDSSSPPPSPLPSSSPSSSSDDDDEVRMTLYVHVPTPQELSQAGTTKKASKKAPAAAALKRCSRLPQGFHDAAAAPKRSRTGSSYVPTSQGGGTTKEAATGIRQGCSTEEQAIWDNKTHEEAVAAQKHVQSPEKQDGVPLQNQEEVLQDLKNGLGQRIEEPRRLNSGIVAIQQGTELLNTMKKQRQNTQKKMASQEQNARENRWKANVQASIEFPPAKEKDINVLTTSLALLEALEVKLRKTNVLPNYQARYLKELRTTLETRIANDNADANEVVDAQSEALDNEPVEFCELKVQEDANPKALAEAAEDEDSDEPEDYIPVAQLFANPKASAEAAEDEAAAKQPATAKEQTRSRSKIKGLAKNPRFCLPTITHTDIRKKLAGLCQALNVICRKQEKALARTKVLNKKRDAAAMQADAAQGLYEALDLYDQRIGREYKKAKTAYNKALCVLAQATSALTKHKRTKVHELTQQRKRCAYALKNFESTKTTRFVIYANRRYRVRKFFQNNKSNPVSWF